MTGPETVDGHVSIVVPVYNDPEGVQRTLDSIIGNTTSDVRIVVVDNGSTDRTPRVIQRYASDYPAVVHETETERQGSYAARNAGIKTATGEVLAFVDADVTVTDGWLSTAVRILGQHDVHYVAPDIRIKRGENPTFAARYDASTAFPIEEYIRKLEFAPTACLIVTRALVNDIGRFDQRLISGGDKEFGNRACDSGYELCYAPEVVAHHPPRGSLAGLVRKDFRVGRGIAQLQQYYPKRYGELGRPPRPSGTKSVNENPNDRSPSSLVGYLGFRTLEATLVSARAAGYVYQVTRTLFETDSSDLPGSE